MQLEDRLTIRTPEGVELSLTLAGLGSRIAAGTLDGLLQVTAIVIITLFLSFGVDLGNIGAALGALLGFLILLGYPILFEVLDGGRSIGKRATGLRVVRIDGAPVGFGASAIRNLMRIIDFLPGAYVVGSISVLATRNNQRLGDLAAGTVVIRERTVKAPVVVAQVVMAPVATSGMSAPAAHERLDVSRITTDEIALIRRFFERRDSLPLPRQIELAGDIAKRISPKVALPGEVADPIGFLARVLRDKTQ